MIRTLNLSALAERCGVAVSEEILAKNITFTSVTTDSRKLQTGDLFVALHGENFDGHDFIEQAAKQGACAAVVERRQVSALPQLMVDNTVKALGQLGSLNRDQFKGSVIAVTGSSGKTTVKEMIAAILKVKTGDKSKVLATTGNLNNHLGVPMMLLQISDQHEYAVIEMGASAVGEIAYLAELAKPHVSVVNNVGTAHVGGFGGVDNIAKGKSEIYQFLSSEGVAVINLDDKYSAQWLKQTEKQKQITFSTVTNASVRVKDISSDNAGRYSFSLVCDQGDVLIHLPLIGEHNVANALAAAACCLALNTKLSEIKQGLETVVNASGRMQLKKGFGGSCLIDDTYNANPSSVRAAIDALAAITQNGTQGGTQRGVLILGDMAELGEQAEALHREMGVYAREKGIARLFTVGKVSLVAAQSFGEGAQHFLNKAALVTACKHFLNTESVVLVKGSRSSGMEAIANELVDKDLLSEDVSPC